MHRVMNRIKRVTKIAASSTTIVMMYWSGNPVGCVLSASIPGVGVADKDDDGLMATDWSTIEDGCGSME